MKSTLSLLVLALVLAWVEAWPNSYDSGYRWSLDRRSYCAKQKDKCYSTGQCCKGLVCAAFDDYFGQRKEGQNPEVPGFCVREKDLEPCLSSGDCHGGNDKCATLGLTGERYCVPRPEVEEEENELAGRRRYKVPDTKGGLGVKCVDSSDCKAYTIDGKDKLCCQDVRRGRMGTRRQCDRVMKFSECINDRK